MKSLYKVSGKEGFVVMDAWLTLFIFPVQCGWIGCCSCFTVIYTILSFIALHVHFECVLQKLFLAHFSTVISNSLSYLRIKL